MVLGDARELNKYIEEDQLPERYGGSRKLVSRGRGGTESISEVTTKVEQMNLTDRSRVKV